MLVDKSHKVLGDVIAVGTLDLRIDTVAEIKYRRHDNHRIDAVFANELIRGFVQSQVRHPLVFVAACAVKHVQHGISITSGSITRRQIDVEALVLAQRVALEGQLADVG
ncbi:hypothetical protein D3C75_1236810 [compost metagenome]